MALAGLTALVLGVSVLGPCLCLGRADACQAVDTADAPACCEAPAGIQSPAAECCEDGPQLVVASTEVPELSPPVLQSAPLESLQADAEPASVTAVPHLPPPSLDRTTVLLI
jgi:hypothetical protein